MLLYKDHHQVIMGSNHAELTLGLMPYMNNDGDGGARDSNTSKLLELEHYVESLEAERKKIEAFKRELPFCMTLLTSGNYLYIHIPLFFPLTISLCMYMLILIH